MRIEWGNPIYLCLLPVVIGGILFITQKGTFASLFQKRLFTFVRCLVSVLVILAMATPSIQLKGDQITTIVLVDESDSLFQIDRKTFLEEINEANTIQQNLGLILFGADASVEQLPSIFPLVTENFRSKVATDGTNLERALSLANSLFEEEQGKQIVLLSDGIETTGEALVKARGMAEDDVVFSIYPLSYEMTEEVQLSHLQIPSIIPKNTEYMIELQIESTLQTTAFVRLYKNNTFMKEEEITLSKGLNRVVFSDYAEETEQGGAVIYKAELVSQTDTIKENNMAYGYTYIEDVPQVLIIGEDGLSYVKLLESSQLVTTHLLPSSAPTSIESMNRYDAIILANVSAEQLPNTFLTLLELYVREFGGGLLVTGGDTSFALGGYSGTILEEILPVSMELKTQGEENNMAMVMVVDTSGSMESGAYQVSPIGMAKEAVIGSLSEFKEKDLLGVLAFTSDFYWSVPIMNVSQNYDEIVQRVGSLRANGGTSIMPALEEALKELKQTDAKEKHIILLTDGYAEQMGYETILADMKQQGITLSTIAVGGASDTTLLNYLAKEGNGRYYYTDAFSDLPNIFAKETMLAGKEYINETEFYPLQQQASVMMGEISALPILKGYVGTTAKSRADIILVSPEDEPILSSWQYGLGKTVAFTTDVGGAWTEEFVQSEEGVLLLQNMVGYILNTQLEQDIQITATLEGEQTLLTIEFPQIEVREEVLLSLFLENGEILQVEPIMQSPTKYLTYISKKMEQGAYMVRLDMKDRFGNLEHHMTGFILSYPLEYDITKRVSILNQFISQTNGIKLEQGAEIFSRDIKGAVRFFELQFILLWGALLLFLFDIFIRRFLNISMSLETMFAGYQKKREENFKEIVLKTYKNKMEENDIEKNLIKENHMKEKQEKTELQISKNISKNSEEKSTAQKLSDLKKKR